MISIVIVEHRNGYPVHFAVRSSGSDPSGRRRLRLHGGLAERAHKHVSDFNPRELRKGTRHEMEHTNDWRIARRIAMDHLTEDPAYYKSKRRK